jgi:hypothetical protein
MDVLIVLVIGLAMLAVVGHGIWVMVGAIFRGMGGLIGPARPAPIRAEMCPWCGHAWEHQAGALRCSLCGWPSEGELRRLSRSPEPILANLRRQVERYHRIGLLSSARRDRLFQALEFEPSPTPASLPSGQAPAVVTTVLDRADGIVFIDSSKERPTAIPPIEAPAPVLDASTLRSLFDDEEATRVPEVDPVPALPAKIGRGERSHRVLGLLAAFLEEKNIRWGELVGGLLIVGCSLALVISFWSSIAERPFLKFGLFTGVTAGLFALGHHAERHWKLPTTALGLLAIATLLTPLNFLAVASLARGAPTATAWSLAGELAAAALFAGLSRRAGRSLVVRAPIALVVGVLVPSIMMLLIRRLAGPGVRPSTFLALGAVPLIAQAGAVGGLIVRSRREEMREPLANDLLRLLGLTTFAAALALGLLVAHGGPAATALHRLAPLLPLAGAPALGSGLLLWRRATSEDLVGHRTAGTAIAAAGAFVMLAGVPLAWPEPAGMIPVALIAFAVLTAVARNLDLPEAHAPAGACLALAYLLGWLVATGGLGWHVTTSREAADALLSSRSGTALVPLVLLFGIATAVGLRRGRRVEAQAHAVVAVLAGALSLGLVAWFGFGRAGDPTEASWVFAVYAIAAMAGAGWFGRHPILGGMSGLLEASVLSWSGSGLVLAALVQGLVYGGWIPGLALPGYVALLAHSALATATASLLSNLGRDRSPSGIIIVEILSRSALATSLIAAAGLAIAVPVAASSALATRFLALALVWLSLAWRGESPRLFAGFQGALTGAVVFAVAATLERRAWYATTPHPWLDPRTIQAQALSLGMLCLAWIVVRLDVRRWPAGPGSTASTLLDPPWPTFDRFVRGAMLLALVGMAVYGVMPGVAQELAPRDLAIRIHGAPPAPGAPWRVVPPIAAFEVARIPHGPALGVGSWALLGLVVVVLLAGQWERPRRLDLLGALLAATMAAPLLAGRWEPQVAAASAFRWSSAVVLLAASALIWGRDRLAAGASRLGWRIEPGRDGGLVGPATVATIALAMLPLAAMMGYVASAALASRAPSLAVSQLWGEVGILFVVLATAGVGMMLVSSPRSDWMRPAGALLVLLGVLPLVAVTAFAVGTSLIGNPMVGPEPGSFFARVGKAASYVPPIVMVAAALVGYAARERSSGFAFAAGLALCLAATVGYLLLAGTRGRLSFDAVLWVRLAQLNAIVASGYALSWIGTVSAWKHRRGEVGPAPPDVLLFILTALGVALNLIILIVGTAAQWLVPMPTPAHEAIAGPWGWAALLLAAGAVAARAIVAGRRVSPDLLGLGLLAVADFLAMGLVFREVAGWLTYHGILAAEALAGGALMVIPWQRAGLRLSEVRDDVRRAVVRWASVALGVVVLFSVGAYWSDPESPWWTIGGLVVMVPLAASLAVWSRRPGLLGLAGALLNLAATFWWLDVAWRRNPTNVVPWIADLLNVNVIALAVPALAWLWVDRHLPPRGGRLPFHRFAAWLAAAILAFVVVVGLGDDAAEGGMRPDALLGWGALAAATIATAAGLWDGRARGSVAGLYLLGLCASGWAVHLFHLPPRWLVWTGTIVLSAYSVATGYLWSRRDALRALADRLGIPRPEAEDPVAGQAWLVPASLNLAATVIVLAFGSILVEPDPILRSISANAVLAEVLAIGLLAHGDRRAGLQAVALAVGVVGAVAWGWAGIAPDSPTRSLDRLVVLLVALSGASYLYGLGLAKLLPRVTEWTRAARRIVPSLLGLAAVALAVLIAVELFEQVQGRLVPMSAGAIAAVIGTLMAGGALALVAAVVPGQDPLGLSERGRTAYVYGCEVLGAVLVAHLRLTLPWLFTGFFTRHWPLIALALAYLGVGLGELFRRQGRLVLAEPLERTGALLPILPLLNGLVTGPRPGEDVPFLVLIGGVYTALSALRTSLGFGALAALAYNAALWLELSRHPGFGLSEHPQLWAIPPALCVLIGAYLNRDRLSETQTATIRYVASMTIYLSSTGDIVLKGVAQAPWLPLVLAALSLAGIFAGIVLRVRGFLFVGLGFLSLSVFTIIWYAAVDLRQTWLWSASGIVVGILILALFAIFEKKRLEVLRMVDQLKEWNP